MRGSRRPIVPAVAAAAVAFSLLSAGCGGRGSPQVASVASTTTPRTTTTQHAAGQGALLAFSRCMRVNGMPTFPDPQHFSDGSVKLTIHVEPNTPRLQAAMAACRHLLPNRGPQVSAQQSRAELADELSFARCMRSHGVTRFPDPRAQGGLTVEMVQAQGIDVHSPAVLRVVSRCLPASHGALTPAKVREAIDNASG